jgi:DNA-binding NarL/FixJ family response regulator
VAAATRPQHGPVRVLIVDDEPLFVEMLEALLAADPRIDVVGKAANGRQAVELALTLSPDVTLMDISMPQMDGIEAVRRIREQSPDACVLMLTGSSIATDVDRSRQAGAAGFLTKDRIATQLVDSILELASR